MGKQKQRGLQVAKEEADRGKQLRTHATEYNRGGLHQLERQRKLMGFIILLCAGA